MRFFKKRAFFSVKIQNVQILGVAYGFWEAILGHFAPGTRFSGKVPPCGPRGSESLTAGLPPPTLNTPQGGGGGAGVSTPPSLLSDSPLFYWIDQHHSIPHAVALKHQRDCFGFDVKNAPSTSRACEGGARSCVQGVQKGISPYYGNTSSLSACVSAFPAPLPGTSS